MVGVGVNGERRRPTRLAGSLGRGIDPYKTQCPFSFFTFLREHPREPLRLEGVVEQEGGQHHEHGRGGVQKAAERADGEGVEQDGGGAQGLGVYRGCTWGW